MKVNLSDSQRQSVYLVLILVAGTLLRFCGLLNQSLWVDELHTMNEADPSIPWKVLFDYLRCCDQHPPLFFIIERMMFSFLGHTELVARLVPSVFGTVSIWTMFLLGREVADQKLGLTAALLTTLNFFLIEYSQEARGYIMAFLFTTLSYLFFLKLLKELSIKYLTLYVFFTLCLLYSHYYSLFIVAAEGLTVFVLLWGESVNRKKYVWMFSISGILLVIGYVPWLPFISTMSQIKTFWIKPIEPGFAFVYFHDYFGHSGFLTIIMAALLIYYYRSLLIQRRSVSLEILKNSSAYLSFLVFFTGIAFTYLIPYVRSVLVVPMLFNRYTIVAIPGFLIMIALAIHSIEKKRTQAILIGFIIFFSLLQVIVVKEFYAPQHIRKTQFRELTGYIVENSDKPYPIVEGKTAWHHGYYLKKFKYEGAVWKGSKESTLERVVTSQAADSINGFWVVGAFNEGPIEPTLRAKLEFSYAIAREKEFYDAWAVLFVRK